MPIEPDDVCLNKAAIMERAIRRIHEEHAFDPELINCTHIDALILNIERACQAAIDLALHLVAREHLGMPQNSADAFRLLRNADLISEQTALAMVAMTGFRNVAVHEYQGLDMDVVRAIAQEHWKSLVVFCAEVGLRIHP
ncbi:type VII toxin-antitoxin system HepT family RNase toxin [Desulfonatronum parangueonense]